MLRQTGYAIDVVEDGSQAVEACRLHEYGAVLMDCQMPEMDGLEATRQIRGLNRRQPAIIGLTAHALAGDREKCLASGMNDYLAKPYTLEQLLNIVKKHLEASPFLLCPRRSVPIVGGTLHPKQEEESLACGVPLILDGPVDAW